MGYAKAPEATVVICSYNGERTLPRALRSLRNQSIGMHRFEVVVVDDGSSDRTCQIAEAAGARVIRLEPNAGLAAARNAGTAAAKTGIVTFIDDDCEADADWLAVLLARFSDPDVDGVGGRVVPRSRGLVGRYLMTHNPLTPLPADLLTSASLIYRLRLYLRGITVGHREPVRGAQLYSVVGANMAFRKRVILAVGGFDEALRFGQEEEDLCRRVHRRPGGATIQYEPAAIVEHHFVPGLRDTLRRSRLYGVGNGLAAAKYPETRLIVYPFPLIVAGLVTIGVCERRAVLPIAALAPLATYPSWVQAALRARSLEAVTHPYLQLAQECCTMVGEFHGWRAGYAPVATRRLDVVEATENEVFASRQDAGP